MITGVFRASYVYVFQPQMLRDGGEPKYQITMLFPKTDQASYQALNVAISQALQAGLQNIFNVQMPPRPKLPLYDGDGVKDNGDPFGEECRGHWVLRASSKTRPSVVDLDIQPILDPNAFYSGCYARATINFYAYNQKGNRGVGCGLNNLQKIADGEPLSGRTTPEEDFGGQNAWNGPSTYGMQLQPPQQSPNAPAGYGQGMQPRGGGLNYTGVVYPGSGQAAAPGMVDPVTGMPLGVGVMGL